MPPGRASNSSTWASAAWERLVGSCKGPFLPRAPRPDILYLDTVVGVFSFFLPVIQGDKSVLSSILDKQAKRGVEKLC